VAAEKSSKTFPFDPETTLESRGRFLARNAPSVKAEPQDSACTEDRGDTFVADVVSTPLPPDSERTNRRNPGGGAGEGRGSRSGWHFTTAPVPAPPASEPVVDNPNAAREGWRAAL